MAERDWSVFDRPEIRAGFASADGRGCEVLIALDGVHCSGCAARAEKAVAGRAEDVRVNLVAKTLSLRFRPEMVKLSSLLQALDGAGLQPHVLASEDSSESRARQRRLSIARIGVATICAMQVMMMAWPGYFGIHPEPGIEQLLRWSQLVIAVPGVLWAGWPILAGGLRALRERRLDMNVTVAMALSVAFAASAVRTVIGHGDLYFDTATMFVWFLTLGRFLESRTRDQAGQRMRLLSGRRALTAQRRSNGGLQAVAIGDLHPGDELVVAPGDKLPADGVLLEHAAELDESLLSGESRAVTHLPGETVLEGSVNLASSALALRVERLGRDTVLAQITHLMQHAQDCKPRLQQLADRMASHFIAVVLLLAGLGLGLALLRGASADQAASIAVAVLVASCPCALSLAVPAALAAATSRLAGQGVLVANAGALQTLARVDTVLLDKTGTLTTAAMELRHIHTVAGADAGHCLAVAAALELGSRHPIASAFAGRNSGLNASGVMAEAGAGIHGLVLGQRYWLGAAEVAPRAFDDGQLAAAATGETCVLLCDDSRALALFVLGSQIRPEAAQVITDLRLRGLAVEVCSGDSQDAVRDLCRQLHVPRFAARQTPDQKLRRLQALQLQRRTVLAVGDGVNDAPLLAAADVAAAMPQGAALTQGKADILLLGDSLAALPAALDAARVAVQRIRENLFWAAAYNLLMLPLAMSGHLAPWLAAAGMSASSLVVVGNALRGRAGPGWMLRLHREAATVH